MLEAYKAIRPQVLQLHMRWAQFGFLFTVSDRRMIVLSNIAPGFFEIIKQVLRDDAFFALSRLTDNSNTSGLPIVRDPERYHRIVSLGFGVWMDQDWRKHGWIVEDVSKNYFTPEAFETSVRAALTTADEYVWIYTETPRWWSEKGGMVQLPPAYAEALRRARKE